MPRPLQPSLPILLRRFTARPGLRRPIPSAARLSSSFQDQPAPPRLPADQQAEFERLQRAAEADLRSHTRVEPATPSSPLATSRHVSTPSSAPAAAAAAPAVAADKTSASPAAGSFSGGVRQGAPPEFEGDKNPKTGEVGGPKNEPLRWGSEGDWSYNGRVTDF